MTCQECDSSASHASRSLPGTKFLASAWGRKRSVLEAFGGLRRDCLQPLLVEMGGRWDKERKEDYQGRKGIVQLLLALGDQVRISEVYIVRFSPTGQSIWSSHSEIAKI